jgi:hypothetical protein
MLLGQQRGNGQVSECDRHDRRYRYLPLDVGLALDAAYRINKVFDEIKPFNKDRRAFRRNPYRGQTPQVRSPNRGPGDAGSDVVESTGTANLTATGGDADGDT